MIPEQNSVNCSFLKVRCEVKSEILINELITLKVNGSSCTLNGFCGIMHWSFGKY